MNEALKAPTDALKQLLARYEGCELNAYLCPANRLTIGYGHVLLPTDIGLFRAMDTKRLMRLISDCQRSGRVTVEAKSALVINQTQADVLLHQDIRQFAEFILSVVRVDLSQNQFDALLSFCFNVGQGAFARSTLKKKLSKHDVAGAADEFGKWIYGSVRGEKKPLPGLVARRAAERLLFLTPDSDL